MKSAILLAIMSAMLFAQSPPAVTGSIEGTVVRIDTGEPVEDARVTLTWNPHAETATDPFATLTGNHTTVESGSGGRFVFNDVKPDTYHIEVAADGYTRQEYGQRVFPGMGIEIGLAAGQNVRSLQIRLTPTGSVSGRIQDPNGKPAVGVPVQLLHPAFGADGQRYFMLVSATRSNDRGDYRFYWVTPGRYVLNAGTTPGISENATNSVSNGGSPNESTGRAYAFMFYPGVMDQSAATIIDVPPGAEISGINWTVLRRQSYRIRGYVIDSQTSRPPDAVTIKLDFHYLAGGNDSVNGQSSYEPATGAFEIRGVSTGSYIVRATEDGDRPYLQRPDSQTTSSHPSAEAPVNVGNGDVDGVVLIISNGISIDGRIRMGDGGAPSIPVAVFFFRPFGRVDNETFITSRVDSDGSFQMKGVKPGVYRMTVALPKGSYIKEARYDQPDILNKPVVVADRSTGTIEIVLSSKPARVEGIVLDSGIQPAPGVQVVLIPDHRDRTDLYKEGTSGQDGLFSFADVAPGDYKVFAWEAMVPYAWFDTELLNRYEIRGQPVHLIESSKTSISVTLVPSGQ